MRSKKLRRKDMILRKDGSSAVLNIALEREGEKQEKKQVITTL